MTLGAGRPGRFDAPGSNFPAALALAAGAEPKRERRIITPFYIAANLLAFVSIMVCWLRGGHPERFGALLLLVDYVVSEAGDQLGVRDGDLVPVTQDFILMLAFGWMTLRTDRWWSIVVTASLVLCVLVRIIGMMNPELSTYAMRSAILGFWIVIYMAALAGVVERWLAGEPAASESGTWERRSPPGPGISGRRSSQGAALSHPSS